MTSPAISSALDPLSSSTLNKLSEAHPPTKKRKRSHESTGAQLATTSIVIRAHAASLSDEPLILEPLAALPRSRLPLSWLDDASSSHSDAQPGGLFAADIPALETDLRAWTEPTVLTVRLLANGGLYVVERVKRGIYSLSRLVRWVHEGDVVVAVKGWHGPSEEKVNDMVDDEPSTIPDGLNWWHAAQIEEPLSELALGDKPAGLDVAVVFGPSTTEPGPDEAPFVDVLECRSQSLAPASRGADVGPMASFGPAESQGLSDDFADAVEVDGFIDPNGVDVQQSPDKLLSGMRDHYLQALYVSKTSVAYFAKGPLTRCRAAFQSNDPEQYQSSHELVAFYREAILAAKKMDLKYRESLPTVVRDAVLALSDGEDGAKKRKSKKKKLGRNGLYAEEEVFIRKWWKDRSMNETSTQESSREAETKKHISDLRLRETQLQILLILEVMALESVSTGDKPNSDKKDAGGENEIPKKPKAKKPQDVNVLLELHLDRLCIWHAVSSEDSSAADSAKASSFNNGHMSGKKVESDAVRDFCTEVIIPFYASRLPDKCKLITRKFGVSGGISPAAKKTQSSNKPRAEPGSEVKRQQPAPKSRRTLQRVLTDEKTAAASQHRPPSLNRSNTAPTHRETKRDLIEPLLPTVLSGSVRGGIQKAKRTENREVDLHAVARQHETKLRKVQMLTDQKKELDAAILTLRKPNRELVAKDIADDAVKRVSTGGGSSRKPKNPVRNPLGQGVQVMATPRGNRKKDAGVGLPPLPRSLAPSRSFAGEVDDPSLADSPVMIPSSSRRPASFSGADSNPFVTRGASSGSQRHSQSTRADVGSIQETPSRPPPKLFQTDGGSTESMGSRRPSSSSSKGKGLFRVPSLPGPRPTITAITQPVAPSTPVSSHRKNLFSSADHTTQSSYQPRSSTIIETPPKQRAPRPVPSASPVHLAAGMQVANANKSRASSPPGAIETPVKRSTPVPETPDKSQSIYAQLGWDDDEMEL
ncbi:hypothetical protein NUU61_006699 [Penicillium alfredii]|uniref:DNA replication regulator Sld3 C-terminal domain-containing protein n=1 Tax=Penicillium alfredii TaxID=1506179 RepID=A0A9W9K3L0_9EURO|nr:uncharacterized protein NUU61_006699 [Penicillium alfredii]KAJ5091829.1 hypothetical protein NUU61_006699 [Penicillium alfredii]